MATPFISRTDLSDYLGRDVEDDPGALIAVDASCGIVRTLTEQDFTEVIGDEATLDGTGTDTLLLPQLPVHDAGTVFENGTAVDDYLVTEGGHLIRTDGTANLGGTVEYSTWTSGPTAFWAQGRQNVTVTYDHGAGTVPSDIRKVALDLAYRAITQGGALGETVGPVSKRYAVAAGDLLATERAILRKYRMPQ